MTTDKRQTQTIVYAQDISARPAPVREVGAIAWIRDNLFKTWLDVFLTIAGITLMVLVTVALLLWMVNSANWWSISFNFRQFMLGRYEPQYEWRVVLGVIVAFFFCGMAVAVWIKQISRLALMTIVGLLILLFIIPTVIIATIPMPQTHIAVSGSPIAVGNETQTPPTQIGFIGKAGEEITLSLLDDPIQTDEALTGLAGFMDSPTNLMRTAAINRLNSIATEAELRDLLERDAQSNVPLFTENQRAQRTRQLENLVIPPPVTETYGLGQPAVTVQVFNNALEAIGEPILLSSPQDSASFTLPADGWYVLQTTIAEGDAGVAVLSVYGIYPIIRSTALAQGEEGGATTGFASAYIRMTDDFLVTASVPRVDGKDLPFYNVVNNQYRGSRPLDTYLRVYLAPFLQDISLHTGILLFAGVAGYWVAVFIARTYSQKQANRLAGYAMILLPPVLWILIAGLSIPEIFNLIAVFGGLVFIAFMFFVGNHLGKSLLSLEVLLITMFGVVLLPQWLFLRTYGLGMLPLLNLVILIPAILAWSAGSATYGVFDRAKTQRNFIITGVLLIAFFVIPKLILVTGVLDLSRSYPEWFLSTSDQRRWGGLLLTMILTIFGIIGSFPIGVGLALGRRSKLPVIKYGCTLFIEVVRGSPFIAVLFLMQLMIPLINPAFTQIPGTIRALVAVVVFSSAYLAENVRGGLQSLPPGQTEAARALGLSAWQVTMLITLPQALRAVIPALVGQFIALFKDTSLVAIVGLTDLTGFVNIMTVQAEFIGTRAEGLFFITVIYFVFSYVMAYVSRLLEASGSGKTRRI